MMMNILNQYLRLSLAIEIYDIYHKSTRGKTLLSFLSVKYRNLAMWLLKPLSELGSISGSYFNCFTCKAINNRGQVALICFTEAKEKHLLISFNNYRYNF